MVNPKLCPESTSNRLTEGFSLERKNRLTSILNEVLARAESLVSANNQDILRQIVTDIHYKTDSPHLQDQYGVPIVAEFRQSENGASIGIHERFFEKSENEQIYIITHELSHAIARTLLSQDDTKQLQELLSAAPPSSETNYVTALKQRMLKGKLTSNQYFSEQVAERLTAYQLGEGRLSGMLAVQAMYAPEPSVIFDGIPAEILDDQDRLEEYLLATENVNPIIAHLRACHKLFSEVLGRKDLADEDLNNNYFIDEAFDEIDLGQSLVLQEYERSAQSLKETESGGLWAFLVWLFSSSKTQR